MNFMRTYVLETLNIPSEDEYKKWRKVYFLENPIGELRYVTKTPGWDWHSFINMILKLSFLYCFKNIKKPRSMIHHRNGR